MQQGVSEASPLLVIVITSGAADLAMVPWIPWYPSQTGANTKKYSVMVDQMEPSSLAKETVALTHLSML